MCLNVCNAVWGFTLSEFANAHAGSPQVWSVWVCSLKTWNLWRRGWRGESQTCQYNNLTVCGRTRRLSVAATNGDPTINVQVLRKKKDGTRTPVNCPQSISLYNKHMGGVDQSDQLKGYYHVQLKCRKYYKYIFWFLFDVAVINSYILSRHYTDLNIKDVKTFRADLAKGLIGEYSSHKRSGRRPTLQLAKRFCSAHFPVRGSRENSCLHHYAILLLDFLLLSFNLLGFILHGWSDKTWEHRGHTGQHVIKFYQRRWSV